MRAYRATVRFTPHAIASTPVTSKENDVKLAPTAAARTTLRNRQLMELREGDIGSTKDLLIRYIVITASGVSLYIATLDLVVLVWLCSYLVINTAYALVLFRTYPPLDQRRYFGLLLGNFICSGLFASMPIYLLIFRDEPALQALAFAGMVGHALFNLSRHNTHTPIVYWDIFCIVGYCLVSGASYIIVAEKMSEMLVFVVGTLAVAGYYVHAKLNVIGMHQRVMTAQAAAAHDQRISAVGRLTGGVAHDFNNSLTVIKGNLELYSELDRPDEKKAVIDEAYSAAERAGAVIAQLLSFSRQSRLAPEHIDIEKWAQEFELLSTRLLPETVQARFQIAPKIGKAYVDAGQLSSAVMNLVINARDAMDGQTGTLNVETSMPFGAFSTLSGLLEFDQYLQITVKDTGHGMDAATLARITEPFFTTKEVGHGSGLGMSMARGFAEQSGGGMQVKSKLGTGTEVTLFIKRNPVPYTGKDLLAPFAPKESEPK